MNYIHMYILQQQILVKTSRLIRPINTNIS